MNYALSEDAIKFLCSNAGGEIPSPMPIERGGTNATTVEEARQNLNFIGTNSIASTADDTPANWAALGTGYVWEDGGKLLNQPARGFIENVYKVTGAGNYLVTQKLHTMSSGNKIYHRVGDLNNGWFNNWTLLLDETNALDVVYPIGSVYISYVSTSPAELFGGTWTAITGVFPYFNAGTGTGGSNTHTLTTAQMPKHTHTTPAPAVYYTVTDGGGGNNYGQAWLGGTPNTFTSSSAGKGSAHNNMPAYQTLYAWRRTA